MLRTAGVAIVVAATGCGATVGEAIVSGDQTGVTGAGDDALVESTGGSTGLAVAESSSSSGGGIDYSVLLEAEDATLVVPFEVGEDAEASNGLYIAVPGIGGRYPTAEARFAVELPAAGRYKLWPRVFSDHLGSNSFTLEIDGDLVKDNWTWLVHTQWRVEGDIEVALPAGAHEITVRGREAGTRLDYLVLAGASLEPPPEP